MLLLPVYSTSNLLVLFNDSILRKGLGRSLPAVSLFSVQENAVILPDLKPRDAMIQSRVLQPHACERVPSAAFLT